MAPIDGRWTYHAIAAKVHARHALLMSILEDRCSDDTEGIPHTDEWVLSNLTRGHEDLLWMQGKTANNSQHVIYNIKRTFLQYRNKTTDTSLAEQLFNGESISEPVIHYCV